MAFFEIHSRTLTKTLGYRVLIIVANSFVIYALTRRVDITIGASLATTILNTIIYYLYERFWNSIRWGKVKK